MLLNMAQEYCRQGHDVSLVTLADDGVFKSEALDTKQLKLVTFNRGRALFSLWALCRFLRHKRPCFVLSALTYVNILTIIAVRLSCIRTFLVVSERAYHSVNAKLTVRRYALEKSFIRWLYPLADKVVGISEGVSQDITKVGNLKAKQIATIYNPVITPKSEQLLQENCNLPTVISSEYKVIVACGRLSPVKDYPTLIRAFARLKKHHEDVTLIILGDGDLKSDLLRLCGELNIEKDVHFLGFVPNPYPYFKRADVFALTSLSEGFGNVIVEALYANTEVVCTDCPSGPREILADGEYGELVPVGDEFSFFEALDRVLKKDESSDTNKMRAEEFNVQSICLSYLKLMDKD